MTSVPGWNGENLFTRLDEPSGAWLVIAIHSSRLGPATGGTRMKRYADREEAVRDACRLASAMTLKFALAGLPHGGGKGVIALPAGLDPAERAPLLRRYGEFVGSLGIPFLTGPDVGTGPDDMDSIAETSPHRVFCRTPARGGSGNSAPATALGVLTAMEVAGRRLGHASLRGARVLVQGAASVGSLLIDHLRAEGANVSFSEVDETLIARFRDEAGLPFVPPDLVPDADCDILAPCALGGILNRETIPRLRCRAVVGAANNQLEEPEDADRLRQRGILYAPDFLVNAGGAIAITGMEELGWTREQADERVRSIGETLGRVLDLADEKRISTDASARLLAERRLERP